MKKRSLLLLIETDKFTNILLNCPLFMVERRSKEEPDLKFGEKLMIFFGAHWRGVLIVLVPVIMSPLLLPPPAESWAWCAYTLLVMAIFWVSECIPLAVTGFMPILIFPLTGVGTTTDVTQAYMNDSVMMFLGSLILASSVEQSGLHKRLAYFAVRSIGYSHVKLLLAMCCVTTFVSMWISNTAATSMMIPIVFAILKVFENEGTLKIFEKDKDGDKVSSDVTACYFCAVTFSATIGGIGTLVGTGTNLVFKGLFQSTFKSAPEYLSFPKYSAFAFPYMVVLEALSYIYLAVVYFGLLRPNSAIAKASKITDTAKKTAQRTIETESKRLGSLTYWEFMVVVLFGGAMIAFFCRSPQIFKGWGDLITEYFGEGSKFIKDSALAMLVCFLMFLLPSSLKICNNFKAKFHEDLPNTPVRSVLDWKIMNADMPYSFMFLLGGGIALSQGAKASGLNAKLGDYLEVLSKLNNYTVIFLVILLTVFVTNFASNVAVCNVISPISMTVAQRLKVNPLWYLIASGISASYCFMIPVGTPGNLIVKVTAFVPTQKMMKAGFGPTVACILWTWLAMCFYAPIIWPILHEFPDWAQD